jgi:hypothetical protein
MKIRFSLLILLCTTLTLSLFIGSSCNSIKKAAAFDVIYTFPKVHFSYVPQNKKLSEITLYTTKLTINFDSILGANHIPSGVIASAYLSRLALVITAPPEANFNWLQSVRMVGCIDSTFQQTTDLASNTSIDPGTRNLNLSLNPVDIKPLLFQNGYYLKILAVPSGQAPTFTSLDMYLDSQVKLHIEPL